MAVQFPEMIKTGEEKKSERGGIKINQELSFVLVSFEVSIRHLSGEVLKAVSCVSLHSGERSGLEL